MSAGTVVAGRAPAGAAAARGSRPVMLLTLNVPFSERAIEVAVDAAGEAGSELLLCDAIPLGYSNYVDQMARRFAEHDNRRELDGVARDARARGIRATQLVFHNPKPVATAIRVCRDEGVGLLVLGADRSRLGRWSFRGAVRRLRRDAPCLLWIDDRYA